MIKFGKKALAVALIVAFVFTAFAGCGKKQTAKIDEKAIAMTVGDTKVTAGFLQFYMRYQQGMLESYFGSMGEDKTVWTYEIEAGSTREETMKESILEQLQELYIIQAHAKDYDVELSEIEIEYIKSVAKEFEDANTKEARKKAYATKEYAEEYMTLVSYVVKVRNAMKKDIDTDIDLEDAKQKRMSYMEYAKTETDESGNAVKLSDKKIAEQKKSAKDFLAKAKKDGNLNEYATNNGMSPKVLTFDKGTTSLDEKVIKKPTFGAFT